MNVRWLTFRVSIDGQRLDRAACRRVRREAMRIAIVERPWVRLAHPFLTLLALILGLLAGWAIGGAIRAFAPAELVGLPRLLLVLAAAVPVMALVCAGFALLNRWLLQTPMRVAMQNIGYELCQACGYWLKGLPQDHAQCPECGADRRSIPEQKP